jgi:hypothetical protein
MVEDYLDRGRSRVEARVQAGEARFVACWEVDRRHRWRRSAVIVDPLVWPMMGLSPTSWLPGTAR